MRPSLWYFALLIFIFSVGLVQAQQQQNQLYIAALIAPGRGIQPSPTASQTTGPTATRTTGPTATATRTTGPTATTQPSNQPLRNGIATFYNANGTGACSFDASPQDLMVGAMNAVDYTSSTFGTAWLCGAYVEVNGPKGQIVVRIVDLCPECGSGHIDLSQEAFARIADPIQGRVSITWRILSPNLSSPVVFKFKEGSNQWWTAVQLRNHRNPVYKFEYQTANGQFKTVSRVDYNYFVESSGMGVGPYTFRVTDIYGNVITESGIRFVEGGSQNGTNQFPAAP